MQVDGLGEYCDVSGGCVTEFRKLGSGLLEVTGGYSGSPSSIGDIYVDGGTLEDIGDFGVDTAPALPSTNINVASGAVFKPYNDSNDFYTASSINGAGTIQFGGKFVVDGSGIFDGVITSGSQSILIKEGAQELSLTPSTGSNAFGELIITEGTVSVNSTNSLGGVGVLKFNNSDYFFKVRVTDDASFSALNVEAVVSSATFKIEVDEFKNATFAGVLQDGTSPSYIGALEKLGLGSLTLAGSNTYTGGTTIVDGDLIIDSADGSSLGSSGNIVFSNGSGALKYGSNFASVSGSSDFSGRFASFPSDQIFRIHVPGGQDITFSNPFGGGNASLVKEGLGKLTLNPSSDNDFPAGTFIAEGTLAIDSSANALGSNGIISFTGGLVTGGTLEYGPNLSSLPDFSARFDTTSNQAIKVFVPDGKMATFASPLQSSGGSLVKSGLGILELSNTANSYDGVTNIEAGTLQVDGSLSDQTAVNVASNATYLVDATDKIASLNGSGFVVLDENVVLTTGSNGGADTFSGEISGLGGLTKAGDGTFILSGANAFTGTLNVTEGTVLLSGGGNLADSTSVTVSSGAIFDLDLSDVVGSISGSGDIDIASGETLSAGADGTSTSFDGEIRGGGGFTKQGSGTLTLSGANTELGDSRIDEGKVVVSNQDALGTGKVVDVDDGATLVIQSSQEIASNFNFANQVNLGSAGSLGASLELVTGSAQISKPIHLLNDSFIRLKADGSELLLDDTSQTSGSYMITTSSEGLCDSASPCQLTVEGPGANKSATLKTFRKDLGNPSSDAVAGSDGIRLYGEYSFGGSTSAQSIDLSLKSNSVFRLSGNSVLNESAIEVDNAEWRLFPDVSLGSAPHTKTFKSTSGDLGPGAITYLSDASNGVNAAVQANTVVFGGGEVVCSVEGV